MTDKTTHFGFQEVPFAEKQPKVNEVFNRVASKYDLMNDLMSGGLHRVWKHQAIMLCNIKPEHTVLDLAGGTGDLTQLIAKRKPHHVVLGDINWHMLQVGRNKLIDKGLVNDLSILNLDAQYLPFADQSFDRIIIGFGLRNVPDKALALKEMARILKPRGLLIILEFSEVSSAPLKSLYDWYSFKILPWLGDKVLNDKESYQYLAESIRKHPNQESLKDLTLAQGFETCEYFNSLNGVVAIHRAEKGLA